MMLLRPACCLTLTCLFIGRGGSHHLLKASARARRSRLEVAMSRQNEEAKHADRAALSQEVEALRRQLELEQQKQASGEKAQEILSQMITSGHAEQNPDGSVTLLMQQEPSFEVGESPRASKK